VAQCGTRQFIRRFSTLQVADCAHKITTVHDLFLGAAENETVVAASERHEIFFDLDAIDSGRGKFLIASHSMGESAARK
jgi:hypothetical protein